MAICAASLACPVHCAAQAAPGLRADLPDAPQPQLSFNLLPTQDTLPAQDPAQPAPVAPSSGTSSSQVPAPAGPAENTPRDKAREQTKEEEHQRVLGLLPNFGTTYRSDAASLTSGEKMRLALRSAIDPATFAVAAIVAGWSEVADSDSGFPWGPQGFGERTGAKYLDSFNGTMIGSGLLPALLRQDPRYFRLGHGSRTHRTLYSLSTAFICKHDKTGKWEPNYSNVLGNIAAGALSTLYYPSNDSGIGLSIGNGFIVTAEGALGGVFQEFWPDISRRLFHKDPTHGLDAQAGQADDAAKRAGHKDQETQPLPPAPK